MRPILRAGALCGLVLAMSSGVAAARVGDSTAGAEASDTERKGLRFRVIEARTDAAPPQNERPSEISEPLSPQQLRRLLARLPSVAAQTDSVGDLAVGERSTLPSPTGAQVLASWPPLLQPAHGPGVRPG
jgi:hypothetical protein